MGRERQLLELALPGPEQIAAHRAALEVRLELAALLLVQRPQNVGGEELLEPAVVRGRHGHEYDASDWRSLFIPRRMRDLTVPSGAARRSAIWVWVKPPKNASSIAWRCSAGSASSAAATARRRSSCSRFRIPTGPLEGVSQRATTSSRRSRALCERRRSRARERAIIRIQARGRASRGS